MRALLSVAVVFLGCGVVESDVGTDLEALARSLRPAIVSPPDRSALPGQVATFTWEGGGSDCRLRVGTRPNAADLHESPPLGDATSYTVRDLPLDGERLYVQLRCRLGEREVRSTNRYTAGVRKGLAIVVDFADFQLEDWEGQGFRSLADVQAMLDLMTDHWSFLSRGTEVVQWDLIRVQLPVNLAPDAYPHIREFREAVIKAAAIDVAQYDVNADGVVDSVWMIASAGDHQGGDPGFDFLHGGSTRVLGVNSFLDSQASGSVVGGFYGNFNHEFGHNSGLPDLYGTYSTVNGLTFMGSTSSRVPADDATAFERERMGWLEPVVVSASTAGLLLPPAHDALAAVKVPTARPYEYFLIEYRKTPESGYGSLAQPYDGLAVYHVFTPSTQRLNPPVLALVPADGEISPETEPALEDLFYPGNPAMDLSQVMRSYLTGEPVFRLENVRWARGGIAFDLEVFGDGGPLESANLVQNGSFEEGADSAPALWLPDSARFLQWSTEAHTGERSVSISVQPPSDLAWRQTVLGFEPGTYLLCGWLKGANIVAFEAETAGGNVAVSMSGDLSQADLGQGTWDWTEACVAFLANAATAEVMCRLGGPSSTANGTVWCDDLSLHPVGPAF